MSIKFIRSGLSTSIQDAGRFGFGSSGVPQSGFMDQYTAQITNLIAGNSKNSPLLEFMRAGVRMEINTVQTMVVGGLKVEIFLNGKKIKPFQSFRTNNGDVLEIRKMLQGNFAYLSVLGGFEIENILSSKSMYAGITEKSRFKTGDILKINNQKSVSSSQHAKINFNYDRYKNEVISVYPGPEFHLLTKKNQKQLAAQMFTLTANCNRMAFPFKEKIFSQDNSIVTAPVLPGTIQLTPGGEVIALMKDAQVTGGYPRILQMAEDEMDILAQKRPGEQIGFQLEKLN